MIKTKEDLYGTYIDNTDKELVDVFIKNIKHHKFCGNVRGVLENINSSDYVVAAIHDDKGIWIKGKAGWDNNETLYKDELSYRKLTLADFKEDGNGGKISATSPRYKYTPVEAESIFDLKDLFENGELYFKALGDTPEGGFGVVYDQIVDESMLFTRYEEGRLLTREEITWQEQLCEEFGMVYVEDEDSFVQLGTHNSEDIINMAKRVVELSGG